MAKQIKDKRKVTFKCFAPTAKSVAVAGDFTNWEAAPIPLRKQPDGTWAKTVTLPPGKYEYRFKVDGQWQDDPECTERVPNPFGTYNCVRVVE